MFAWGKVALALVTMVSGLLKWLERGRLIKQGERLAVARALEGALRDVDKALEAANAASLGGDADYRKYLQDKYTARDD